MVPEFVEWKKIFRLHRDFEITEKIDGTNGVILWVDESNSPYGLAEVDGLTVFAGSRSRWLNPDADNFGFAGWVRDNADRLRGLGPGYHFGEWAGRGIQRGYGLADRRFLLFDHQRHTKLQEASGWSIPVSCVPFYGMWNGSGLNAKVEEVLDFLRTKGSLLNDFPQAEGIVLKHTQSGARFKVLLEGDSIPKSMRSTEVCHV